MRLRKSQAGRRDMMIRRTIAFAVVTYTLFFLSLGSSCQAQTHNTNTEAKQSDKVLLEQAVKAINKSQYHAARLLLETLINDHPGSALVPQAKLSIGDAWYAEGNFKQAELEYRTPLLFSRTGQKRRKRKGKSTLSKQRQNSELGFRSTGEPKTQLTLTSAAVEKVVFSTPPKFGG
jgi:Outer membrane lipoprotein